MESDVSPATLAQRYRERTPFPLWLIRRLEKRFQRRLLTRLALKRVYIGLVTGLIPLFILILFRDPVKVMSASGIIAAAHTPFIVMTALYVNATRLPKALRPGLFYLAAMAAAGLFYLGFAVLYLLDFSGLIGTA